MQVCTAVMHYGFGIVREMEAGLHQFMEERNYNTIYDFAGKALPNVTEWKHLNLEHKVVAEKNADKCIGCELCYISFDDGAHQAIFLSDDPLNRIPSIIEENCVGCNLCSLVCLVEDCITMVKKDDGLEHNTWNERSLNDAIPRTFDDDRAEGKGAFCSKTIRCIEKIIFYVFLNFAIIN